MLVQSMETQLHQDPQMLGVAPPAYELASLYPTAPSSQQDLLTVEQPPPSYEISSQDADHLGLKSYTEPSTL